jgi:tetratricopeptide (TPR) repeat protein
MMVSIHYLAAQNAEIESLRKAVLNETGTKKIDALNVLSLRLVLFDFNLAEEPLQEALKRSTQLKYAKGLAEANVYSGMIETFKGNRRAFALLKNGGAQAKQMGLHGLEGLALLHIGLGYRNVGKYDSAILSYDASYHVLKDSLNPWHLAVLLNELGRHAGTISDKKNELLYYTRAWNIAKELSDNQLKVDNLVNLTSYYSGQYDFATATVYMHQAEALLPLIGNTWEASNFNALKATILIQQGNGVEALKWFGKAKDFYASNPEVNYVKLLNDIGFVLEQIGIYDVSLQNHFEALKIAKERDFLKEEVRAQIGIGWNYLHLKLLPAAHEASENALRLARRNELITEEATAGNLNGLILNAEKKYSEALVVFEKALAQRIQLNDKIGVGRTLTKIGETYEAMGSLHQALAFQQQSLNSLESLSDQSGLVWVYYDLGSLYTKMNDFKNATIFLDKAAKTAYQIKRGIVLVSVYQTRRTILMKQGNLPEAMRYSLLYEQLKDSVTSASIANRVATLQSMYELEQRSQEIELLNKNQQVQQAQLTIQKAQIRQQEFIIVSIALGLLLVAAVAYFSYRFFIKTRTLNKELQEQNEEIQTQSEELTETNSSLTKLNQELVEKQEEIQAQAEELTEANQSLTLVNMELAEKSEELAAQSEELTESNQIVSSLNENLERKVKERTQSLEQAYKELDTFFYRSSHDFRRPLTTFMGLAEVAKITVKDSFALDLFDKVKETAVNLDSMLIKLQSISDVGTEQFIYKEI